MKTYSLKYSDNFESRENVINIFPSSEDAKEYFLFYLNLKKEQIQQLGAYIKAGTYEPTPWVRAKDSDDEFCSFEDGYSTVAFCISCVEF